MIDSSLNNTVCGPDLESTSVGALGHDSLRSPGARHGLHNQAYGSRSTASCPELDIGGRHLCTVTCQARSCLGYRIGQPRTCQEREERGRPCSIAQVAICIGESSVSLARMCLTWLAAVPSVITNSVAICGFVISR